MKLKLAVPRNVLNAHQIGLLEDNIANGILGVVQRNFPNWRERVAQGNIAGGEIILQDTDMTRPIAGLRPGIHVTVSLISYMPGRNFDGLGNETIDLIKGTRDETGNPFMQGINVFVQMSLDSSVVKRGTNAEYSSSGDGRNLLEYSG
ncbi:MAG: hypothetical protein WCI76_03050 [bacterium]